MTCQETDLFVLVHSLSLLHKKQQFSSSRQEEQCICWGLLSGADESTFGDEGGVLLVEERISAAQRMNMCYYTSVFCLIRCVGEETSNPPHVDGKQRKLI